MKYIITIISAAIVLSACGKQNVSFDTLETARTQGKANAEFNAQAFRAASPQFANTAIVAQTDSTMSPECPQGDGWASVKLVNKENPAQSVGLKCSTVSSAVGCMTDGDFQKKSYAGDDGRCQDVSKVPFPIPKVAK
jgi:major membrane immunogen (membrane-anchored lipoprotein)